jgi:hypothetical protein
LRKVQKKNDDERCARSENEKWKACDERELLGLRDGRLQNFVAEVVPRGRNSHYTPTGLDRRLCVAMFFSFAKFSQTYVPTNAWRQLGSLRGRRIFVIARAQPEAILHAIASLRSQ